MYDTVANIESVFVVHSYHRTSPHPSVPSCLPTNELRAAHLQRLVSDERCRICPFILGQRNLHGFEHSYSVGYYHHSLLRFQNPLVC